LYQGEGSDTEEVAPRKALRSKLIDKAKFIDKVKFIYLVPRKALRCPKRCSRVKPVIILEFFFWSKMFPVTPAINILNKRVEKNEGTHPWQGVGCRV